MRASTKVILLIAVTLGGILPISVFLTSADGHGMVRFGSYAELEHFLLTRSSCSYTYGRFEVSGQFLYGGLGPLRTASSFGSSNSLGGTSSASSVPSHSETNNQVAGVDELDTVKSDGQYIYTVSNDTVVIVNAYPVTAVQVLARIPELNQTIDGIFIDGTRLSIVSEAPRNPYIGSVYCRSWNSSPAIQQIAACTCSWPMIAQNTSISVYDITNRSSPRLQTTVTVNGTFVGARLIGDYAYLIATTPAQFNQTLPVTVINGRAIRTEATHISHSDVSDTTFSYTTILSMNIQQANPTPTVETYMLGASGTIYVSLANIFLTQPTWDSREETVVHRVSIAGSQIKYEATGSVPGHVLNQFSMDEYNGYFRVATSGYFNGGQTGLYVLDQSMTVVGKLEGISEGETFHSARFMGDKVYLVTFKRTDPLFVISLQQPKNPSLLGQLNVTGVSDYLQPYDGSHLIGIGKSAQDVAWENAARFLGLKISLFDVSNPQSPSDMSDFTIGDRGTDSPGLTDQKAVLFERTLNLLVLPIEVYGTSPLSGYSGPVSQGAFVFQVTLQNGILLRGSITHIPSGSQVFNASPYFVTRALYIGNTLYTISSAAIRMNSLTDLSDLGAVSLL